MVSHGIISQEQNIVADGLSRLTEDIPTTKECFPDSKLPQEGEPNDNIIIDRDSTSREHVGHEINSQPSLATPHLKKSRRNRKKVKMSQDNSEMQIAVIPASPLLANGQNIPADIPGTLGTSIFDMDISDTQSTNTTTTLVRTEGSAEQPLVEDTISTLATSHDATDLRQPQPDSLNTPNEDEINISPTPNETSSPQGQEVGINDVILIPDGTNTMRETNFSVIPESNEVQNLMSLILPEHYNWFNSVHNCWMGHRGSAATLHLLQQRDLI
jgi:hypothetical protein